MLPSSMDLEGLPLDDETYNGNKLLAEKFFDDPKAWQNIDAASQYIRAQYPKSFPSLSQDDLDIFLASVVYDEVFRRDIGDEFDDLSIKGKYAEEDVYSRTLGIAQINPSIHLPSIKEVAQDQEITIQEGADFLMDDAFSEKVMAVILYKNSHSDPILAVSRYHGGNISDYTNRALYLRSDVFIDYITSLRIH